MLDLYCDAFCKLFLVCLSYCFAFVKVCYCLKFGPELLGTTAHYCETVWCKTDIYRHLDMYIKTIYHLMYTGVYVCSVLIDGDISSRGSTDCDLLY